MLAAAIVWLLLAGALLFILYGLWLLSRVRRGGLGPGRTVELAGGAVRLRYPHWWSCSLKSPERARLLTHDHDGELTATCLPRPGHPEEPVAALSGYLRDQPIRFDEWNPTAVREGPVPGAMLQTTATLLEPDEERRANLIFYLFEGPATRLLLAYRCSVLYGLVDGFYLDRMVRALQIDDLPPIMGPGLPPPP